MTAMRVAVVDIGSNSTRLLVADVDGTDVTELARRSTVTRLGEGVDHTGALGEEPIGRVFDVLGRYRAEIDELGAATAVGVLTSAVRDAANGPWFAERVRERFGIAARVIPGDVEAELSYLGATSGRERHGACTVVIDVGGGSTELIVGVGDDPTFHRSTQVGVVRHTERHLHDDPPTAAQLAALRADAAETFRAEVPAGVRAAPRLGIAVAGTATQSAAIELGLEPYDPARVDGHVLRRPALEAMLERLAAMPPARRREVGGLDPERAPTIVAGVAILLEAMAAFALGEVFASEHDILRGAALRHSDFQGPHPHF